MSYMKLIYWLQEYSEDTASEPDVDLENQYYNSKALKDDDPRAALENFQKVAVLGLFFFIPVMTIVRVDTCYEMNFQAMYTNM